MKFKSICPSLSPDALDDLFVRTMYCFGDDGGGGGGGGGGASKSEDYDDYDGGRFDDDDTGFDDGDTGDTGDTGGDDESSRGDNDDDDPFVGDEVDLTDSEIDDIVDDIIDDFVGDEIDFSEDDFDVGFDEGDVEDTLTDSEIDTILDENDKGLTKEARIDNAVEAYKNNNSLYGSVSLNPNNPDVIESLRTELGGRTVDQIDQFTKDMGGLSLNEIIAERTDPSTGAIEPSDPSRINDIYDTLLTVADQAVKLAESSPEETPVTDSEIEAQIKENLDKAQELRDRIDDYFLESDVDDETLPVLEAEPEVEPEFETPPRDITDPNALDTEELRAEMRGEGSVSWGELLAAIRGEGGGLAALGIDVEPEFDDGSQVYQDTPVEINVPEVTPYAGDDADVETLPVPEPEDIFVGDEVAIPTEPYDDYDDVFGDPGGTDPFVGEEIAVPEENKISTTIDSLINAVLSAPTPGSLILEGLSKEFPKIAQAIKEGTYDPEFDYGDVDDITLDERVSYISPNTGELNTRNFNIGDDERDQPYVDTYVNGKFTRVYGPIENLSKQYDPSQIRGVDFDEGDIADTIPIIDEPAIPQDPFVGEEIAPEADFTQLTSGTLSQADDPFVGDEIAVEPEDIDDIVADIEIGIPDLEPEDPFIGDEIDYSDDDDLGFDEGDVGETIDLGPDPVAPVTGGGGDDTSASTETAPSYAGSPYSGLFGDSLQYNPFEGQDPFEYDVPLVTDPFRPEELFGSYTLSNDVAQGLANLVNAGYAPEYLEPISQMDEARREQEEIMALIGAQMPTGTPVSDEDFQYFELSPIEEAERLIAELSNDQS